MANLLHTNSELESNPEIKSYIYQQLLEFEPYVTASTVVAVVAKDPRKLASQLEAAGQEVDMLELSSMYRIAVVLSEDGTKVEAEGLHEDIYEAIKEAKQKLLQHLADVQDQVVDTKERNAVINHYLQNPVLH